jgi:NADH-quinone oxidoreductase subunit N
MICFISAYDFVSFYLALELQSLSFYILATFKKDSAFSTESGLKYFILGALSSGFLLFGMSLIYGSVGSTNFEVILKSLVLLDYNDIFTDGFTARVIIGSVFILISILFKLTAAPFHMWAPDVYEGAPTTVSIIFASVPKLALFVVLLKVFYLLFYDFIFFWQHEILFCSLISILVGTFSALRQTKIKRFLAFSSVTHVGFLLIAFSTGTLEGVGSLFFYMIIYIVMTLNAWSIVLLLEYRNKGSRLRYITDLQNLSKTNPVISFTLAMNLFSMAGVPPLAGFFAKMYIFFAGLEVSLNLIVIVGIVISVISAFYYLRFIKLMYFDGFNQGFLFINEGESKLIYLLGITLFIILFFFLNPNLLALFSESLGVFLFSSVL